MIRPPQRRAAPPRPPTRSAARAAGRRAAQPPSERGARRSASLTFTTAALAVAAGAALLLAGCATPGAAPPAQALADARSLGAAAHDTPWPEARWWERYRDPELNRLVDRALAGQPSLQAVQARLRVAEAGVRAAQGARAPQAALSADLTDTRFTEHGMVPPPLGGATLWNNNLQAGASWEIDLFGRQRSALDAAVGRLRAAQADAQAARVLLAANVAAGYFNLARLDDARGVARDALQQREQIIALVRERIGAGLDTQVDLKQAEGLVAQSRVEIETLDEAIGRARHALAELAGLGPGALDALSPALRDIASFALPASVPADLLGRRADLVAQRWRVEAAARERDVARKQFYPNLDLTAFMGLQALGFQHFLDAGSRTYGVGPALHLPLFEGGRLQANLDARRAEVDAAVDAYNGALQRALREVADELTGLRSLEQQQRAQRVATQAADDAHALALQRYRAGLGNFLVVLTAQTNVLAQRRAETELKARHLASEVALVRALGGGYAATELPPAATGKGTNTALAVR